MLIAMNNTGQSQEQFAMTEGGGEGSQKHITKDDIVAFNFALVVLLIGFAILYFSKPHPNRHDQNQQRQATFLWPDTF